jgi:hypothetical protein
MGPSQEITDAVLRASAEKGFDLPRIRRLVEDALRRSYYTDRKKFERVLVGLVLSLQIDLTQRSVSHSERRAK